METGGERGGTAEDGDERRHQSPRPPRECYGGAAGVVELKLGLDDPGFDLEKVVCSHGLFMMAPNQWDPATRTFQRPLRLCCPSSSFTPLSVVLRISHPHPRPSALHISVLGAGSLSPKHQQILLAQVKRMLRISDEDDRVVEQFHRMHPAAKERGFGRVFRSPTLFEDMVKCILLCNCLWSRTLAMARALCELQLKLSGHSTAAILQPSTPRPNELKNKYGCAEKIWFKFNFIGDESDPLTYRKRGKIDYTSSKCPKEQESCATIPCISEKSCAIAPKHCPISNTIIDVVAKGTVSPCYCKIGEFPSPEELAGLNEKFFAKYCGLGYRAKRILSLALNIVEGKLQLEKLEENCDTLNPSCYDELNTRLSYLDGFGLFTRANVLMCMGFYHKIPADSETIRHLKKIHSKTCTLKTVQKVAEDTYGEYAPLQYLAYWSELWNFYEQRFGKSSQMPPSDYHLITARYMEGPETPEKRQRR